MSPFLFTNTGFLIALAALAIPILIHLLLRRKKRRLRFSTIRFFTRQDERSAHRRKLRHLLLLATRLLLLALLVLAFARPYLPRAASADPSAPQRQWVLVLDRSASMQAGDRWAQAMTAAREALGRLEANDRVALIDATVPARVLSPPVPPAKARALLDDLTPAFGVSDLGSALQEAVKFLPTDGSARATLQVISDLQQNACETLGSAPVPQGVETRVALIGEPYLPNLTVSGLELESARAARVELRSYSDQPAEGIPVEVTVNSVAAVTEFVDLPARATMELLLPLPALDSGWHTLAARISSGDRFGLDDVRHQVVHVPEPVPALCVETDSPAVPYEAETYYLLSALNPRMGSTNGARFSPFQPEPIEPSGLARRLAQAPPPRLIFLPAQRHFPPELGPELVRFVEQGGGLALFVGESFSPNRYLAELGPLLPAAPGTVEGEPNRPETHWRMRGVDPQTPLFQAFRRPDSGDLSLPVFKRRFSLEPAAHADVPARFSDGAPFVVTTEFGQGRVAFINTTADTTWTDWPKRRTFVPWIHGLAHWLLAGEAAAAATAETTRVVGAEVELVLGAGGFHEPLLIGAPDGTEARADADAAGRFTMTLDRPGVYSVRHETGEELRRVAVHLPSTASDLRALTPGEFQQRLVRIHPSPESGWMSGWLDPVRDERHFWRLLLMAGAVLLLIELLLANRTFA
jgi:hypothetical protein